MKNIFLLSGSLGLTCLVAAFILFNANQLTKDARARAETAEQFTAMRDIFPECQFTEDLDPIEIQNQDGEFSFYPARKNQSLVGFAGFGTSDKGYGGAIRTLTGIDLETERIRKIAVVSHAETPGLGSRVAERRERRSIWDLWQPPRESAETATRIPPNQFLDQFDRLPLTASESLRVTASGDPGNEQEVVAISGATISSQAVADAVSQTLNAFRQEKDYIIDQSK